MALTLTFSDTDILESTLFPSNPHGVRYRVYTETTFFGNRKVTTITPVQHEVQVMNMPSGVIHWKQHTMTVGERTVDWENLKRKSGGFFSTAREWQWSSMPYTIEFDHSQWIATPYNGKASHGYLPIKSAVFNLRRRHLFKPSEPAYLQIALDVPAEDQIFLMLVMIYSECKRQDRKRRSNNAAAAGAAASSGGGGGGGGGC